MELEFDEFNTLRDKVLKIFIQYNVFYYKENFLYKNRYYKKIIKNISDKENINKYFLLFSNNDEAWYCLRFSDSPYNHICPVCGKFNKFQSSSNKYGKTCSKKCSSILIHTKDAKQKAKQTNLEKYGVDNPAKCETVKQKIKQTNLKKYGTEYALQSKEVREKINKTNLEKYGTKYLFNSSKIQEKIKQSNLKKYGVENLFSLNSVQEKIKQTNLEKYGNEFPMQNKNISEKSKNNRRNSILFLEKEYNAILEQKLVDEYGSGWAQVKNQLNIKYIKVGNYILIPISEISKIEKYSSTSNAGTSLEEKEVFNFLKENYKGEILTNKRTVIYPYELDIYIPEKKVAIEYDGLYWHSSANLNDKNYHLNKTEMCNEKGIRLIHIFSDEWKYKKEIVKSIILSSLGIYKKKIFARKCLVKEIALNEYKKFLNENHIQGEVNSVLRLGLFYNDDLVQVAGWGKSRFKENEIELHRMATKNYYQVIGGFSKLINHSKLKKFVSYIDRRLFNGYGYKKIGFELEKITEPSYFYVGKNFDYRENRLKYQKHKLINLLENFNPNLTEEQNMKNNKIFRIYDCGTYKVLYKGV